MDYDFELEGKKKVYEDLLRSIKSETSYLITSSFSFGQELIHLKKLQELISNAIEINESSF